MQEAEIDHALTSVEDKLRFLGSLAKNRAVVSLFIILHLAATMFVNDCWRFFHGDCGFRLLGRLSFQHLYENPFWYDFACPLRTQRPRGLLVLKQETTTLI